MRFDLRFTTRLASLFVCTMSSSSASILVRALLIASLSGCLSVEVVPRTREDAHVPQEAGQGDAAAPPLFDASDGHVEMPPIEPIEPTAPEPVACEAGVTAHCIFDLRDRHGFLSDSIDVRGDYIYWIDLGTEDERENYLYDGAIMRTRVGVWAREQLLGELDFYDEGARRTECVDLRVLDDYLIWNGCGDYVGGPTRYIRLSDPARAVHTLPDPPKFTRCTFVGAKALCYVDDELRSFDLARDSEWSVLARFDAVDDFYEALFHLDGALYIRFHDQSFRAELDEPEPRLVPLMPSAALLDVLPGPTLVAELPRQWIGVALDDETKPLAWTAVAGPGEYIGTRGAWFYWLERAKGTIARTRRNGEDEMVWSSFKWPTTLPRLSSRGMFTDLRNNAGMYAFRYEPLPPD